jgi:hypothetical protein
MYTIKNMKTDKLNTTPPPPLPPWLVYKSLSYIMDVLIGKSWPVTLGTGVGLGMGYANCQHTFYSQFAPRHRFGPPWSQMVSLIDNIINS